MFVYFFSIQGKASMDKESYRVRVTEFFLRIMTWLCLRNDGYRNSQMVIITGPNQELAIKLIKRMKGLFAPHNMAM